MACFKLSICVSRFSIDAKISEREFRCKVMVKHKYIGLLWQILTSSKQFQIIYKSFCIHLSNLMDLQNRDPPSGMGPVPNYFYQAQLIVASLLQYPGNVRSDLPYHGTLINGLLIHPRN